VDTPVGGDGSASDAARELRSIGRALAAHLSRRAYQGLERVALASATPAVSGAVSPVGVLEPAPRTSAPVRATAPTDDVNIGTNAPQDPFAVAAPPGADAQRERARACATLDELRTAVAGCTACRLATTRTQTVFSDGPARARVMFIGEAPGQHEDEQGVPFVGLAGQLLTDIIQKGMGLARREVHIANVLKCRPPGNRDPEADEKALCTPFLDRQIELVDPEILVTLGLHATRHVLRSTLSMARLRGQVHRWNGRKVVATYHPAFLLRNPAMKKDCWQDIQLAMRELGIAPPARPGQP